MIYLSWNNIPNLLSSPSKVRNTLSDHPFNLLLPVPVLQERLTLRGLSLWTEMPSLWPPCSCGLAQLGNSNTLAPAEKSSLGNSGPSRCAPPAQPQSTTLSKYQTLDNCLLSVVSPPLLFDLWVVYFSGWMAFLFLYTSLSLTPPLSLWL